MISKRILVTVCLPILIFMGNVQAEPQNTQNHATTNNNIYTEDKLNITINAKHPEFTLKIKSNPTTGYSWFLREYDSNLITPVKHSFEAPAKNLMGASGYELWTFRVNPIGFTVPHQTVIRFIYARPFQGNDSATQLVFRVSTLTRVNA